MSLLAIVSFSPKPRHCHKSADRLGEMVKVARNVSSVTQGRQWTYTCDTEARVTNHCCRGKKMPIICSERAFSLRYPACKAHAPYCVIIGNRLLKSC